MVTDSLNVFDLVGAAMNFSRELTDSLLTNITTLPGIDEIVNGNDITIDGALDSLKIYVIEQARDFLKDVLDEYMQSFIDNIMKGINSIMNIDDIENEVLYFFTKRINVLRAEITLTIWEVRG